MPKVKQDKSSPPQPGRRNFLKKIWAGLGILAGFEFSALSVAFLWPRERKNVAEDKNNFIAAGTVEDFPPKTVTPFRRGHFYLVRMQDGGFLALSLRCSHLGCSVAWNSSQDKFICPCHASSFDIQGDVINPPAPHALDIYPVIIENGFVKVNTGKPIQRKRFLKTQATYA